jgi:hypothetical protein
MTDEELKHFIAIRVEEGKQIAPSTAECTWEMGAIADPYGVDPGLPDEAACVGPVYFARRPGSDVWVSFRDLPKETREALWKRGSLAFLDDDWIPD